MGYSKMTLKNDRIHASTSPTLSTNFLSSMWIGCTVYGNGQPQSVPYRREYCRLVGLYAVAMRPGSVRLQNHILTEMRALLSRGAFPKVLAISLAYLKTDKVSPLQRFMVDAQFAVIHKPSHAVWFQQNEQQISTDLVLDSASAFGLERAS